MDSKEKILSLRKLMNENGWDAAIISGSDPHSDEYVPERWQARKWISGFTGSAGDIVVTMNHAGLWTDSRYFIQAEKELEGSGIELHKTRLPDSIGIPEWLESAAKNKPGFKVVADGLTMNTDEILSIRHSIGKHGGMLEDIPDYLSAIWKDRPDYPAAKACTLPLRYSGKPRKEKIAWLRGIMSREGCAAMLLSVLDDIAWLFNIRGGDIEYNPLLLAYAVITLDDCEIFTDGRKFSRNETLELQKDGIDILPYESVSSRLATHSKTYGNILIDRSTLNFHLYETVTGCFGNDRVINRPSPIPAAKSVKNGVEIRGMKKAALMDGIAMTRFFIWLDGQMRLVKKGKTEVSEIDAAEKLRQLRKEAGALDESFGTISAYGQNAALPHYSATENSFSYLKPHGLYLVDSGGQYPYGTTDITRTIPLGRLGKEERRGYTLVLKGMIALSRAIFPKGSRGTNLDALAREALWQSRMDYGHGTGHGVGHRLCVHEGPQAIRHNWVDCPLLPGMITSNEPGLYVEGRYGIRHENLVLCKEAGKNRFGEWLCFETVTYVHIDTSAIDRKLLTKQEINWLNSYNRGVLAKLSRHLDRDERKWLAKRCRPIK